MGFKGKGFANPSSAESEASEMSISGLLRPGETVESFIRIAVLNGLLACHSQSSDRSGMQ